MTEPLRRQGCSLVTPLYNERDNIEHLWASVQHQTRPPDEWIITDNGSTDGTYEWLVEHAAHSLLPVRVLSLPSLTIAQMTNRAIALAAYDVIAGCHGGTHIAPDWLAHLLLPLQDPSIDVVGGVREPYGETPGESRFAAALSVDPPLLDERTFIPATRSIAFRYTAWAKAGGLPEWLPRFGEDTLFGIRLKAAGCSFALAPAAKVGWRPKGTWRSFFRQQRLYSEADAVMGLTEWHPKLFLRPWGMLTMGVLIGIVTKSFWGGVATIVMITGLDLLRYLVRGKRRRTSSAYWIGAWFIPLARQLGYLIGTYRRVSGSVRIPESDRRAIAHYRSMVQSSRKSDRKED